MRNIDRISGSQRIKTLLNVDIPEVQKMIELLESTALNPKISFLKSLIYLKQGKYQDAIYLLRNLSKVNRRDSLVWQALIEALQQESADLKNQLEIKNLEIGELKEILRQRESSLSWRFSQFYGRYFSTDSRLTRFISYFINKIAQSLEHRNTVKTKETKYYKQQLESILKSHEGKVKGIIIYPPTVDWNIPLFQRPQQLALKFSELCYLFFYCTGNIYDRVSGFKTINDNLYITNQYELLIQNLSEFVFIIHSAHPTPSLEEIEKLREKENVIIIYEYIDEIHPDISGISVDHMVRRHKQLLEKADCVLASADTLYEEAVMVRKKNTYFIPNGVDYNHFHIKKNYNKIPSDIKSMVNKGNPIIGYYGALAKWFDYELVKEMAKKRPNYEIVLIGWDYDGSMRNQGLEKFKNIHYLGIKKYPILPKYAVWFDVATIPFVLNKITESTSPIKIFEYMALGKPIVTTDLRECRKYKSILIGKDYEHFIENVDKALELRDDPAYLELLDKEAKENTWESRVKKIDEAIQEHFNLSFNILNYKSSDWFKEINRCQEEVATLCTNLYYKTNYQQAEALYWLNIPKWIDEDSRLNNVASVLDIGCGYGTLLLYAMRKYNCDAFATDFTDAYLSKKIIAKYGIKFEINNIELNPFSWRKTFDRIIFTEVLEHLNFNPSVTLKKLNTLLSNNGKLFLSTPDAKKWGRITKYYRTIDEMPNPKPNTQIVDDHVYIYSKKELKNILERSGFKIEKIGYSPGVSARHFNVMAVKK